MTQWVKDLFRFWAKDLFRFAEPIEKPDSVAFLCNPALLVNWELETGDPQLT